MRVSEVVVCMIAGTLIALGLPLLGASMMEPQPTAPKVVTITNEVYIVHVNDITFPDDGLMELMEANQ